MTAESVAPAQAIPLERLTSRISEARAAGLLPGERALNEWYELAQAALADMNNQWLAEKAFRAYSGASDNWCRGNFEKFQANGLARQDAKGKRIWHVHARIPRVRPVGQEAIKKRIVDSFKVA